jgi:hypothetical protein
MKQNLAMFMKYISNLPSEQKVTKTEFKPLDYLITITEHANSLKRSFKKL